MSTHTKPSAWLLFVGVIASAVIGTAPAEAHPASSCSVFLQNVEGTDGDAPLNSQDGLKANVHAASFNDDCLRVSSLAVLNGSGVVEFGWKLGWDYAAGNLYTGPGACANGTYRTTPQLFVVWVPIGGGYHCKTLGNFNTSTPPLMAVHDTNGNTVWDIDLYSSTSQISSVNVNFTQGAPVTNGERHSTGDSAYAEFTNLAWQTVGLGSTWRDFENSQFYFDNNPDYHWVKDSNTHTEVQHD